jgi:hypothetical protein
MGIREEFEDALKALREAEAYATSLEPKPGERHDNESLKQWATARQLVAMLQAAVDRLARRLADPNGG